MNRSLRQTRLRLTAMMVGVFFAVGVVATIGVWLAISRMQYAGVDSTLSSQAQLLVSGLQDTNGRISFDGGMTLPDVTTGGIAVSAVIYDASGHALAQTGPAPSAAPLAPLVRTAVQGQRAVTATVTTRGTAQRVLVEPMPAGSGVSGVLVVDRTLVEVQETLFLLAVFLGGTLLALTAVVATLAYGLAGRAMRPVRAMTATLQQFTADAAHELRAPLALMRAELETSLSKPRAPDEYRRSEGIALREAERMSLLADQLLTLARSDAGALQLQLQPVDLADLIDETVARWQPLANAAHVTLACDIGTECTVRADQSLLRRLLDNLVDNALRHTPALGRVQLALHANGTECAISVADTGPGVPVAQRTTLFDRFTRGDAARGRETGGAGLGLAVCRTIAQLHGGTITLDDSGPGAAFRVRLPIAH